MLQGGDTGPALVPGKAGESLIVQAMRHQEGLAMPPKKPRLPETVIADFEKWIAMGAPMPAVQTQAGTGDGRDDPRRHWAFQPTKSVSPPTPHDPSRMKDPIDAFVLARLEEKGWTYAPPASRGEWIRRVTFDLTGLPPTPGEIDSYEKDASTGA